MKRSIYDVVDEDDTVRVTKDNEPYTVYYKKIVDEAYLGAVFQQTRTAHVHTLSIRNNQGISVRCLVESSDDGDWVFTKATLVSVVKTLHVKITDRNQWENLILPFVTMNLKHPRQLQYFQCWRERLLNLKILHNQ